MARKPYSHQVERAKDLLRLIHIDVCGPFKIVSRQGARYFVTFTDDFSWYGYVCMLKHKHEVFETFKEHGIISHRTPPYTPQHNGVSERRNQTLLDMVRSMMSQTTLRKSFWDYAFETAARILNMVPTKKVDKTPYEIWHGQAPNVSYLKVWGCEAFVKRDTLTKPDKLDPRSFKCIFVGYPKETMGYSFYSPSENKVFVARNAEFFESKLLDLKTRHAPDRMCLYIDAEEHELGDLDEPANYKAALLDPESKKWLDAMNVEMQSMKDNDVWVLVELPPNAINGFTQTYGIDYEETFSPVADIRAIRILIAIVAYYDYEIWQMDVKTAFLNGHLSEEVYMEQPEDVKSYLGRSFAMKDLGEAAYIIGIKIYRYRSKRLIGLCQKAYIEKSLKRFYMENSKCGTILMQEKLKLSKSQGEEHWTIVKNILKYLRNTKNMFLVYGGNMERELRVSCYTDVGYLTDADNLKSQTGYVFVLNGGVVDWKTIAKDDGVTKGARHFHAKVHYLRKTIKLGDVYIEKIHTYDNLADPLTKDLAFPKHSELTRSIGLLPASSFL
nr:hypothetical protein [Tanacetum cinerariifolium]